MKNKAISCKDAVALIPDGARLMIGGFMGVGTPRRLIEALVEQGRKGLTVIANDTARPDVGIGKLIDAHCVERLIVTHIGTNPETQRQMMSGEIKEVELCPQGTLIERIRCGGFGLGGVLTKTGLGTKAAEGQRIIQVQGEDYVLGEPVRADFALLGATRADYRGNVIFSLTSRNFNPLMAFAADTVFVEPGEIVPTGVIPPDDVMTPHVLVDYLIERRQPNGR